MKTLLEVLELSRSFLEQAGVSRRFAEEGVAHALGMKRLDLYLNFDRPLQEAELDACRQMIACLAKGEPFAYVAGKVEFLECKLSVNRSVLIPRPETEILAQRIIDELAQEDLEDRVLWDIGCGSGCLGLALKRRFPELRVVLADVCEQALAVAQANAEANSVKVDFRLGDLLTPFASERTHYVVSNPPYVSEAEWEGLTSLVKEHEPKKALVSGETGLECYQHFARLLPGHLEFGGHAWFEIGSTQGASVSQLFSGETWGEVTLSQDWAGHDRFIKASLP